MNDTDAQAPNTDCKPKLHKNYKLVLQIWLVNHNVVSGSTKMLIQEHVKLGKIRICVFCHAFNCLEFIFICVWVCVFCSPVHLKCSGFWKMLSFSSWIQHPLMAHLYNASGLILATGGWCFSFLGLCSTLYSASGGALDQACFKGMMKDRWMATALTFDIYVHSADFCGI